MMITPAAHRVHTDVIEALQAVDAERVAPGLVTELEATLELIEAEIITEVSELTDVTTHLFTGASKLIRPIFLLLCAATRGGRHGFAPSTRTMAAVIEIAHVATLYHDDVMDEAYSRRGLPSANLEFGNSLAVMAGDLLLSRALDMACGVGLEQCQLVSNTLRLLCQGQALEMRDQYNTERSETDYIRSIAGKTAELFAASCTAGALEAGCSREDIARFATFGRSLGLAFQIVDDIHDVCQSESQAGKPTMNDIREGVYSLPVVAAMRLDDQLKHDIAAAARGEVELFDDIASLRQRIVATGGIEHAQATARAYISEAISAISSANGAPETIATLVAVARALVP